MPYRPEHRDAIRKQLIRSARVLFNRKGFDRVSIDEIMSHAGLTRGVFYSYFNSKGELYSLAVGQALIEPPSSRWPSVSVDFSASDAAQQVIRAYLSQEHMDDIDGSCPMVSLPSDISRSDATVKRVFETVFQGMVGLFEQSLARERRRDRDRALTMSALCVGAMVIARALDDESLAGEVRNAAMHFALELGGWSTSGSRSRRRKN
jgi:TetR/AcrR family transcriptional regulator, transcriptional repressor for nem operon